MRNLILLFALSFSFTAFSSDNEWAFKGVGKWMSVGGEKGNYKVMVEGEESDGSLMIKESFEVDDQSWSFEYTIVKKEFGFADIMKDDEKIGEGYCFKHGPKSKTCHMSYTYMDKVVEKTCHKKGLRVMTIGSVRGGDHAVIKFASKMRRVKTED